MEALLYLCKNERRWRHEKMANYVEITKQEETKGVLEEESYLQGKILNQQLVIIRKMDASSNSHHTNGRFPCNVTHTEAILGIFRRLFLLTSNRNTQRGNRYHRF